MTGPEGSAGGAPRLGSMFGRYRIESVVGRGGMGVVVRARDTELDRVVALKFIAPELLGDPAAGERFLREARAAAAVEHPHIVPVYEVGWTDGTLYLAMRAIAGPDLGRVLRQAAPLAIDRTLGLAAQVADALDAAHAQGLIHRDVKPGNVLVEGRAAPEPEWAWLTDFGLTRRLTGSAGAATGGLQGTLDQLAPELITGTPVGPWTDQYAFACVIVQCLTGSPPFEGPTEASVLHAHLERDPATIVDRLPDPRLGPPLVRALAKDGQARHSDCRSLVRALRTAIAGAADPASRRTSMDGTPVAGAPMAGTPLAAVPEAVTVRTTGGPASPARVGRPRAALVTAGVMAAAVVAVAGLVAGTTGVLAPGPSPGPSRGPVAILGGSEGIIVYAAGRSTGRMDLWAMNPDGTGARKLFDHAGNDRWPDVTPDGSWVVFTNGPAGRRDLWQSRPDGTELRQLTFAKGDDYAGAISPDGRRLAWVSDRSGDLDIWIMTGGPDGFDEQTARNLIRLPGEDWNHEDVAPAWTPDGSRILFSSSRARSSDIWSLDPDDPQDPVPVTLDQAAIPDGAPVADGNGRIVFVSGRSGSVLDRDLWSVDAPGTAPEPLLDLPADITSPAFSPDGRHLVAVVGRVSQLYRPTDTRLVVMDPDGGARRSLPRGDLVAVGDPRWVRRLQLPDGPVGSPSPSPPTGPSASPS